LKWKVRDGKIRKNRVRVRRSHENNLLLQMINARVKKEVEKGCC
jgi:hypothetical protein